MMKFSNIRSIIAALRSKIIVAMLVGLVFDQVKAQEGRLVYAVDSLGNKIPDFSYAGYKSSNEEIPFVPVLVYVTWQEGDQTSRIQKAIDYVSSLPLRSHGFRGAVLLEKGVYQIDGGLKINTSGVVLRGSGTGNEGTRLLGTGQDRETLMRIYGKQNIILTNETRVTDDYVPVGGMKLNVSDASKFQAGDEIQITRPSTQPWIDELKMNDFGGETGYIGWKPGERDINWNRTITAIDGNEITIDAPITTALDQQYGGGLVSKASWLGRIENVGVENLILQSTFDESNQKDEQHRWMAVTLENIRDAWVRQVNFEHFAGSAVAIYHTASRITVEDCKSLDPVSEIGGQRRYTFFTEGQQCLFQRLYAEYGYHDFATGFMASGPNAFVQCKSYLPYSFSGAIDSWASGVLFDIVNVDGQALRFGNRGAEAQGAGWTAANSMFWQCTAALIECQAPPTAINWAIGVWGQFSGDGYWHEANSHVKPRSLFYGQLSDRVGKESLNRAHLLPITNEASSSPTLDQASVFVREAENPQPQLKEWIDDADQRIPIPIAKGKVKTVDEIRSRSENKKTPEKNLALTNGWLTIEGKPVTGHTQTVQWWRGNVRYYDAAKALPHVTRYVPGRIGTGLTDDLGAAVDTLLKNNVTVLDHNYGLWYDRRRDDHQRIRRMNGEVWAPFYELPFARSGQGTAYDGLSKYDLTTYNFWYWNRLKTFADLADQQGLVLLHQNYFQHNVLEAGGHYADFPWRTANSINHTPFPEPPNYAGDKRIFMAAQFYDVGDPDYRKLHEAYIRKCLENFSDNTNVIQFTSAEYTGPLAFMQFWIDEIRQWQEETGTDRMVALSATKDVQDSILNDPGQAAMVDLIDIRYWWYGEDKQGNIELYAPPGGANLAPRQHARLVKTPKETFESVYRAVYEYRMTYSEKAVSYNAPRAQAMGWASFMAGGSLAAIPDIPSGMLSDAVGMQPLCGDDYYLLRNTAGEQIVYFTNEPPYYMDLSDQTGTYELTWIDPESGNIVGTTERIKSGQLFKVEEIRARVLWLNKI